ncbi:helix-hairpin-helix domain-containing protein, partial [Gottfriedia acidiceleris]
DINHASQSELEKIPGVGPAKAKNILDYIDKNGPFTSVEQLESVNGIGKKSLEKMTPFIVIR